MPKILNLGCADKIMKDAINVDVSWQTGVDDIVDLSHLPWPWEDKSIDGIYARHILEHFIIPSPFLEECSRILKPGAFLEIYGPHCSCISSVGMLEHSRTFSYDSFNILEKFFKLLVD